MGVVPYIISGLSTLIALVALICTLVTRSHEHVTTLQGMLGKLDERCTLLELKIGVFWRLAEEHLALMLKKPTHVEMDALLDKLADHTLTLPECYELRRWLYQVYLAPGLLPTRQERLIAVVVSAAVEALILELERSAS